MTETRKRPDWTLWLNLPKLKVWQAVALSLDIDPDSMKPSPHGWMSGPDGALSFIPASFAGDAQATEFDKRRRIAAAQLAGRENADRAEVALRPFLDLAAGLGWPIPDALRLPMAGVSEPLLALVSAPDSTATAAERAKVAATPIKASQAAEKQAREDARLAHCEAVGLVFDMDPLRPLPYGIAKAAESLDPPITRQSLSTDVKASLRRRFERVRNGKG